MTAAEKGTTFATPSIALDRKAESESASASTVASFRRKSWYPLRAAATPEVSMVRVPS